MPIYLEIEGVFSVTNRGVFVMAKQIDPALNFYVTEKSFLGGIELEKFLDVPRSIDENGKQRCIVALKLKNPEDKEKLAVGSIHEIIPGNKIHFLSPWHETEDESLKEELHKELSKGHVLYGKKVKASARRSDMDDVLFELIDDENQYAVVHLTWSRKAERDKKYPVARLFKNWLDLYNNCIVPDHQNFFSQMAE